jgi:hypothetical protein
MNPYGNHEHMRPRKSWVSKRDVAREPKRVPLKTARRAVPGGAMLLIPTPGIIDDYIRAIPYGQTRSIPQMRKELANDYGAAVTCPMSTGKFIRMVAEAALEEGVLRSTPLWRLIEPDCRIAQRLLCGPGFISRMRRKERNDVLHGVD